MPNIRKVRKLRNARKVFACKAVTLLMMADFSTNICWTTAPTFAAAGSKQYLDITMAPALKPQAEANGELRTDAKEAAEILRISGVVETLRAEKIRWRADSHQLSKSIQQARLLCLWKIFEANEEIRKAIAAIDYDLAVANERLDTLTSRLNDVINLVNTANFAQGGTLGVIKQSLALHNGEPGSTLQEIAMTSFGNGTALGLATLLLPNQFTDRVEPAPNSLAEYFDPKYMPPGTKSGYLGKFLNSKIPGTDSVRRELLVKHWQAFAGLNSSSQVNLRKLSSTPAIGEDLNLSINSLHQRIALLQDLRTHIEEFDGCLYELHKAIAFD